jgi:predicted choloylglycine hydrolase
LAVAQFERYLPELAGTYAALADLADDDLAATMLTLWDPPKFLPGCSQVGLVDGSPALLRNYDYSPDLFEQVVYSTMFDRRRVIGTSDCLWGLLDGMNDSGLAVSLAFGGRPGSAPGFAAPIVVRYLLEVAGDVPQACEVLRRVPVAMSYNLTMVDGGGEIRTAFVAPGQPPEISSAAVATNHRGTAPEFPEHARRFRSVERQERLTRAVAESSSVEELTDILLRSPIRSTAYAEAFGTLYTAIYRPLEGEVEYRWPTDRWVRTFSSPEEVKVVSLGPAEAGQQSDDNAGGSPPQAPIDAAPGQVAPVDVLPESTVELGGIARRAIDALATRPDQAAFVELLRLSESVGLALGNSARILAEHGSWSLVGDAAGVSRQAAWHRWS